MSPSLGITNRTDSEADRKAEAEAEGQRCMLTLYVQAGSRLERLVRGGGLVLKVAGDLGSAMKGNDRQGSAGKEKKVKEDKERGTDCGRSVVSRTRG